MPILVLTGDDEYRISQAVLEQTHRIPEQWRSVAVHRRSCPEADLLWALQCARQMSFSGGATVTVLEGCKLKDWSDSELAWLQQHLPQIPAENTLVLVAASIDKRLKLWKHLAPLCQLREFNKPKPWDEQAILAQVGDVLPSHHYSHIPLEALGALCRAVGNDLSRTERAVEVLRLYAPSGKITSRTVTTLVPCQTQSSLQLADAVRKGNAIRCLKLLAELQDRGEVIQVVLATLVTQFRTWWKLKSGLMNGLKDRELTAMLQLANPGRLYYLKQEVQDLRLGMLGLCYTRLVETDAALKRGARTELVQAVLMQCCLWMKQSV